MALRTGHGTGAGVPRIEVRPANEQAHGNANDTAANLAKRRGKGRPFQKGNAASKDRKPGLALLGVAAAIAAPDWRNALAKADRLRRRRCSELSAVHGYVSAGTSSIVASAELALAASRIMYAKAFETGDLDLFAQASKLANDARQNELAAWELATREAAARPRGPADATPWLVPETKEPAK